MRLSIPLALLSLLAVVLLSPPVLASSPPSNSAITNESTSREHVDKRESLIDELRVELPRGLLGATDIASASDEGRRSDAPVTISPHEGEEPMHYKNGREAKIGDHVVGTAYNTNSNAAEVEAARWSTGTASVVPVPKVIAGILVKAVPGSDTCNAEVEFIESTEVPATPAAMHATRPRMAVGDGVFVLTGDGKLRVSYRCRDYTHVGALLHVEDAFTVVNVTSGRSSDVVTSGGSAGAISAGA